MVDLILKFVSLCRTSDLKVSTSEVLDCISQLTLINLTDESQFKAVLNTNFVKTRRDQSRFEMLYALYFHDLAPDVDGMNAEVKGPDLYEEILEKLRNEEKGESLEDAIVAFMLTLSDGYKLPKNKD